MNLHEDNALVLAVRALIEYGRHLAAQEMSSAALAEVLAESAEVREVNHLASRVALGNSYAVRPPSGFQRARGARAESGGRRLTTRTILDTGLAAYLCSVSEADIDDVAHEISEYLAGPPVEHIRLIGLDAYLILDRGPIPLAGWELFVANTSELERMLPLPTLTDFQPDRAWNPKDWAGLSFLRQRAAEEPSVGPVFYWPTAYPEWDLWRPLLVLALASSDVVTMWSEHLVEPGRRVDKILDRIWYQATTYGPDEFDFVERPEASSIYIEPPDEPAFRERLQALEMLLPAEPRSNDKPGKRRYERLTIAARRLLAAGEHAVSSNITPLDPVHATEALLNYVVALEALLAADSKEEIARRVSQRAAVLAGRDDTERLKILKEVKQAYGLRSSVIHGLTEPTDHDLSFLRNIVRKVFIAKLALDKHVSDQPLEGLCDFALVSSVELKRIREHMAPFDDVDL